MVEDEWMILVSVSKKVMMSISVLVLVSVKWKCPYRSITTKRQSSFFELTKVKINVIERTQFAKKLSKIRHSSGQNRVQVLVKSSFLGFIEALVGVSLLFVDKWNNKLLKKAYFIYIYTQKVWEEPTWTVTIFLYFKIWYGNTPYN